LHLFLWFSAAIVLIQLSYWILFYFGISRNVRPGQAMNIPASVIVCAHDEEQNLRELLPLLLNQNHPEFEIIVVDDRSNDGTYDFLLEETQKDLRLKMVHVNHKPEHVNGKKYALTLGIKAAKFDWVLLTDADCRPASAEWIRQMAGGFTEQSSLVLGYSPYKAKPGLLNLLIRFETIITAIQYFSFASIGLPYMGVGRNLAYRKKLFLDNKGFNNHMAVTGGDDDLFVNQHATNKNIFVVLHEKALMVSAPKTNWKDFQQQKVRHLSVGKHYSLQSKILLAPFGISSILFWPFVFISIFSPFWFLAIGVVLIRWMVQMATLWQLLNKTREKFNTLSVPLLDFIFCFYYLVTGFKALVTKRIKWKT
jgi:glycosyltransferase involved in cell wall biosynthesis